MTASEDFLGVIPEVSPEEARALADLIARDDAATAPTGDSVTPGPKTIEEAAQESDELFAAAYERLDRDDSRPFSRDQFFLSGGGAMTYALLAIASEIRALRISLQGGQE